LKGEHGLSLHIGLPGHNLLFDTGQSDLFMQNASLLDIDPGSVDTLVLSHNHYDHTGGVPFFLKYNKRAKIYAHPKALRQSFSSSKRGIPESILKKIEVSDRGIRKIGFDEKTLIQMTKLKDRLVTNRESIRIADNLWLTGEIPRENNFEMQSGSTFTDSSLTIRDFIPDDQALIVAGKEEIAVILGCCHAGVLNTVEYVGKIFPGHKVRYIIGGMHLIGSGEARINMVTEYLEQFKGLRVLHGHCTGFKAGCAINAALKGRAEFLSAGSHYELEIA